MVSLEMHEVDARRLFCPLPVIRLQQKIDTLSPGEQIVIVFTDPGGQNDIPAWCRVHGHRVLTVAQEDREFRMTIEVGS